MMRNTNSYAKGNNLKIPIFSNAYAVSKTERLQYNRQHGSFNIITE